MRTKLAPWAEALYKQSQSIIDDCNHGHLDMWLEAIAELPEIKLSSVDITNDTIRAGVPEDCDDACRKKLYDCMQKLRPWRKGPFDICGMKIDTEWRSDWKWNRLERPYRTFTRPAGAGYQAAVAGYHTWRMAGAGAKLTLGIDPYKVFVMQYWAMKHFLHNDSAWVLPLGIEDIPPEMRVFNTVFSNGRIVSSQIPD